MTTTIHLAIPPNIIRKSMADITRDFPEVVIRSPQTHPEMDVFFQTAFGKEEATADLTVTAYPDALKSARAQGEDTIFRSLPTDLIPMRSILVNIGYKEPDPFFKVIAVVTMLIIYHQAVTPAVSGWCDLCREDLIGAMVIPPDNTPAPAVYACYMERICGKRGKEAAEKVNARLLPQDINTAVDSGEYKAGMVFPAFARTFRKGHAIKVWPREGAITLPLLAFIKKKAPKEAEDILRYLLGEAYQTFISKSGLFLPVRPKIPLFEEMIHGNDRLHWLGWDNYCSL
jgi:hypothetical protein